ncbi:MAG: DUF488 family protein [Gemmatales bacterium]|nr:DUF488 family protein [Gemmatales bacterium]MDW8387976.1 DUF488 family protein [Gemmatales bacterium]
MIHLKRAYDKPSPTDGFRVLVERHWPRDLDEKHAKIDLWLKEVAPSDELRVQFGHDPSPERWPEFEHEYWLELQDKHKSIKLLRKKMKEGPVTLVHAAHNPEHSAAAVLKRFLEQTGPEHEQEEE